MRRPHSQDFAEYLVEGHTLIGTRAEFFKPVLQVGADFLVRACLTVEAIDQQPDEPGPLGSGKRKGLLRKRDISYDHRWDRKRIK